MIISSTTDYREAARRRLPPFLFHYIDGGAYAEHTLGRNVADLAHVALRQRVLQKDMSNLELGIELFGEKLSMPVALSPVGLTGMYARRGEVQAARAAEKRGVPFTMSSVSVCPIEEVVPAIRRPMWFQLYVLKDRGFMKNVLERAKAAGCSTLVFTVDMPTPGALCGGGDPGSYGRQVAAEVLHGGGYGLGHGGGGPVRELRLGHARDASTGRRRGLPVPPGPAAAIGWGGERPRLRPDPRHA